MFNSIAGVQVSDTTDDDSSNEADCETIPGGKLSSRSEAEGTKKRI